MTNAFFLIIVLKNTYYFYENNLLNIKKRLKKLNAKSKVWLIDHIKTPNEGT